MRKHTLTILSFNQQESPSWSLDYFSDDEYYGDDNLPLQLCQGDCDDDGDCAGGLKCFQRYGFAPVPGCSGNGIYGYDYCIGR